MLLGNILGTAHMIFYENNVSQRKFFVRELEPSLFIKKTANSPTQYAKTRPFSALIGQLHEVL
jgi:hypothetical protein